MKVAHVLRKYVPAEWGGTETAVKQLLDGMQGVEPVVFAPKFRGEEHDDPGPMRHRVQRYRATLPVVGISAGRRRQLESVGGNLLSLDLLRKLGRERGLSVVHTHALNRVGGAAMTAARRRGLPFVVTVHGGAMDLAPEVEAEMVANSGLEWGKVFGAFLGARKVLEAADAIVTVNPREAEMLRARYPKQRVLQGFHGVDLTRFEKDHRAQAADFGDRPVVLVLGRIDPVKNQAWVAEQWGEVLKRHPRAVLALAGATTDERYGEDLKAFVEREGFGDSVRLLGGVAPGSEAVAGLLQRADVVVVSSKSETFGLVVIEAWAAGAAVVASKTTGTTHLIDDGESGLLFDLEDPRGFHRQLDSALSESGALIAAGRSRVKGYSIEAAAAQVSGLYDELLDARRGEGVA